MFNQSDPISRWKLGKTLGKKVNMKKSLRILTILSFTAGSILFVTPSQAAANDLTTVNASSAASILNSGANGINIVPGSEVKYGSVKSFTSVNLGANFSLQNPGIFMNSSSSWGAQTSGIPANISTVMNGVISGKAVGTSITSLSAIEFDFTVSNPAIKSVYLDFLFTSEESTGDIYDVAGFIVDGTNYAYLSNGSIISPNTATESSGWSPNSLNSVSMSSALKSATLVGLIDQTLTTHTIIISVSDTWDIGCASMFMVSGLTGSTSNTSGYRSLGTMTPATSTPAITASGAPTSVTATSTGATTANVSFTAPASDGGATITSYTATSSPSGITGSISQAGSGTIAMTGLTAGTTYTFTVTATNSAGTSAASSASNSITTVGAPSAPTSVAATATGKRSATVSFGAPASNNGSAVTSYTATSTPGGITQTLTQATGGTFNFDGLQPGTAYTFAVTATNAIGTSSTATSNSVTTTPLVVASLSSLSFADDGTGTGGKIVWSGKSIDAVLYTGPANSYPGPYNYGAFTGGWNGRIRNLTPGTEYTVSLFVVSADGVGESKSLTFKTSATLPALAGAASATISQADAMTAQLPKLLAWINENVFVEGEGDRMKMMLNKFDALVTSPHRSHIKVPTSRVLNVVATSLTPLACSVVSATAKEHAGLVKALSGDTCTISYTVSGGSKAPATMVKDFVFKKFAK